MTIAFEQTLDSLNSPRTPFGAHRGLYIDIGDDAQLPLSAQEEDLRSCLEAMQGGLYATVGHWQRMESYRVLVPEKSPDYLKELFYSNLRALLEILPGEGSKVRSGV